MYNVRMIALQTINRIFAEAAYMFIDIVDDKVGFSSDTEEFEGVSLKFDGDRSGEFHLWTNKNLASQAAANMLGIDENSDLAGRKGQDALKELLNMIAGNFLTAAFGYEQEFQQGLPLPLEKKLYISDAQNEDAIRVEVEGNPVLFAVILNQEVCP